MFINCRRRSEFIIICCSSLLIIMSSRNHYWRGIWKKNFNYSRAITESNSSEIAFVSAEPLFKSSLREMHHFFHQKWRVTTRYLVLDLKPDTLQDMYMINNYIKYTASPSTIWWATRIYSACWTSQSSCSLFKNGGIWGQSARKKQTINLIRWND